MNNQRHNTTSILKATDEAKYNPYGQSFTDRGKVPLKRLSWMYIAIPLAVILGFVLIVILG